MPVNSKWIIAALVTLCVVAAAILNKPMHTQPADEWVDTQNVVSESLEDYPPGTNVIAAYHECLKNSVLAGDHSQVSMKKCNSIGDEGLGHFVCLEKGYPSGKEFMYKVIMKMIPDDRRCLDMQLQSLGRATQDFGNDAQKEAWRRDSTPPSKVGVGDNVLQDRNLDESELDSKVSADKCEFAVMDGKTVKACKQSNGKYKILPLNDGSRVTVPKEAFSDYQSNPNSGIPPTNSNKALGTFNKCLLRSIGKGDLGRDSMQACVTEGMAWCNSMGLTTTKSEVSPVTGKLLLDNSNCALNMDGAYRSILHLFEIEFETYQAAENVGEPYVPVSFDIRKYVGSRY